MEGFLIKRNRGTGLLDFFSRHNQSLRQALNRAFDSGVKLRIGTINSIPTASGE
jgi:hypothetical protein